MLSLKSRRRFLTATLAMAGMNGFLWLNPRSFAAQPKSGSKLNLKQNSAIVFQGDSITDGNRGRNGDLNHIMGHGYAFCIAGRVGADYPQKKFKFFNRGISGNKVNDLSKRWQSDTIDLEPDLLSILVGVNDAASVVYQREPIISVEKYEEIYRSLLDKTLQQFPNIILVLCEPFVLKVGKIKENWERFSNDIQMRQAVVGKLALEYNAILVKFQSTFDHACEKADPDYWMWDGVHPTVAGHELMAREWMNQVEKRVNF